MAWIPYLVAFLFLFFGGICVLLVALQLPGTWTLLGLALVIELGDSLYLTAGQAETFGWEVLILCLILALLGEVIEFIAGAVGVKKGGGTKRGVVGSLAGGIVGFFLFAPLFAFLPLFGPLLGALLGTFVGAFLGELSAPRSRAEDALKPAAWATLGRVVGTTGKVGIAMAMWIALSFSAFWRA